MRDVLGNMEEMVNHCAFDDKGGEFEISDAERLSKPSRISHKSDPTPQTRQILTASITHIFTKQRKVA